MKYTVNNSPNNLQQLPQLRWLAVVSVVLAMVFVFTISVNAESWPRKKRTTYIHLGLSGLNGSSYYGSNGDEIGLHRLEEQTYGFYSEYGYSKYVTGIVHVPGYRKLIVQESAGGPTYVVEAPGDIDLGLKVGIFASENDVISLTGLFGIPIGETANTSGLWSGDDEFNQLVSLGYTHAFGASQAFVSLSGGYNFRSEGYSDEIHVSGEASIRPLSFLEVVMHVRSVASQGNGDPTFIGGSFGYAANNTHYLVYGPELALWFSEGFGVNAAVQSVVSARNAPSALLFSTGVFFILTSSRGS